VNWNDEQKGTRTKGPNADPQKKPWGKRADASGEGNDATRDPKTQKSSGRASSSGKAGDEFGREAKGVKYVETRTGRQDPTNTKTGAIGRKTEAHQDRGKRAS